MSHNDIQRLDGIKRHNKMVASQHPLQLLQVDLGYVLDAHLRQKKIEDTMNMKAYNTLLLLHTMPTMTDYSNM